MAGLDVAAGIARGAAAFSQAFQQARLQKFQMKQQKNDRLAELLLARASDPNTKFHERASIINEYQKLYDPKPEQRLSTILGYDKLNEQDFDTGQVKTANVNPEIPTVVDGKIESPNAPEQQDLARGTETPIIKKYGDMTPAQVHAKLQLDLEKARDKGELKKAKVLARFQFDLAEKSYKANGYKVTGEGMVDGEYVQVLTNNAGEQKTNRMPKGFKPLKLEVLEKNANKPSTFIKERVAFHVASGKSEEEAEFLALQDSNEKFKSSIIKTKQDITKRNQEITGTTPISASQKADDGRAERQRVATLQANINRSKSETIKAGELAGSSASQATNHWKNVVEPLKARINAFLIDEKENPNAPSAAINSNTDFKSLQLQLNNEINRYNDLKETADRNKATFESLQGTQKEAEDILTGYSSGSKGSSEDYSQYRNIIDTFKRSNPAVKDYSDAQVVQILRDAKRIK